MPSNEPKWEVVDEIPGEKKPAPPSRTIRLLKSKALWIGVAIGAGLIAFLPVLRAMALNLARAWWLWVGLLIYWYWRRMQRRARR